MLASEASTSVKEEGGGKYFREQNRRIIHK
jgi:hypothetical protein